MSTLRVSKRALLKQNVIRIYLFSTLIGVVLLLAAIAFHIFDYYFMSQNLQSTLLICFAMLLFGGSLTALALVRTHRNQYFEHFTYIYWTLFCAIFMTFSLLSIEPATSIVCYWLMMMGLGLIPVLRLRRFIIIWAAQFAALVLLLTQQSFSSEGLISIITINIMCIVLNMSTYNNCIKNLSIKASLTSAITQAETDPMTQLLNRRGLMRRVSNIWPHCVRQRMDVAILMLDIDNFKKYNDSFGHAQGDECIKAVTGAIRNCTKRQTDYAARVGGEEFLVLLTGADSKQALIWARNLKEKIEDLQLPHSESNFLPFVTVSIGVACCQPTQNISFEQLRESADQSLYAAKEHGRACISMNNRFYDRVTPFQPKRRRAHG